MGSRSKEVLTKQGQIALNAKRLPEVSFTSLAYHMDKNWFYEAYLQTRKDGAEGVDGITSEEYGKNLGKNLDDLLERAKSGKYRAPAVKRVYIPKGKRKEMRPIGMPTFEDKILQRAVKMLIEPIYEQDFYGFSYGFRLGRSQHQALDELWKSTMRVGGWIIDLDIKSYFDRIDHEKLRSILKQRVSDGVISRLIGKWLKAGIMENGNIYYEEAGTPQGGVISPLLSNIYLHEVLDEWYMKEVKPRLKGKSFIIRYADDAVIGFSSKEDALRVMKVIHNRFEKFGLIVHPKKTKIIKFSKPKNDNDKDNGTFNFLGFTHYWGKSRKGKYTVRRKTQKERFSRSLRAVKEWCKRNRHMPISEQVKKLSQKLIGHYAYFGITQNYQSISIYFHKLKLIWYKWLNRRSRKKGITRGKFNNIISRFPLPRPRIVHSYLAKL